MEDALGRLTAAGVRVLLVGLPMAQLDLLEKLQVIPVVVAKSDVFSDFDALRMELPGRMGELGARSNAASASV